MELLLAIGIMGVLASVVIIAINPNKQLQDAENAKRKSMVKEQENAMMQHIIGTSALPSTSIPQGEPQALPICRVGVTNIACINISSLAPTYLVTLPVDSLETSGISTGYYVYLDNAQRPRVCSFYLPTGDSRRCSTSTYVPGTPTGYVCAGAQYAGGAGTAGNPYQICSCSQLQQVTGSAYYNITHDIDCTTMPPVGLGNFTPINSFSGVLDGQNYTIDKVYIDQPGVSNVGLFKTLSNATIRNLKLTNINYSANDHLGGLAGTSFSSQITNVSVTGALREWSLNGYVGGLVGQMQGGTMTRSWTNTAVNAQLTVTLGGGIGGLVGDLSGGGNITNCYTRGNVTVGGSTTVGGGGVVGRNSGGSIGSSYAAGHVTVNGTLFATYGVANSTGTPASYYDNSSYMVGTVPQDSASGRTFVQMQSQSPTTYVGWDMGILTGIWQVNGGTYPTLR